MKKVLFAVLSLAACVSSTTPTSDGGSTDFGAVYVGNWQSSIVITAEGADPVTENGPIPIQEMSLNVIQLQGFCSDTNIYAVGPDADVTASGFTLQPDSCTWASSNCSLSNIGFSWDSGGGNLDNGTLTGNMAGSITCGGSVIPYTYTFSSSTKTAYGSSERTPGMPSLGDLVRRAFREGAAQSR